MENSICRHHGVQFEQAPYWIHFISVNHNIYTHWHEYYEVELAIVADGAYTIINGKKLQVKSGSIFFMTPSDFHAWQLEDSGYIESSVLSFKLDAVYK